MTSSNVAQYVKHIIASGFDFIGAGVADTTGAISAYAADIAVRAGETLVRIVLHIILLCCVFLFTILVSISSYLFLRGIIVPNALIHEQLYFDYSNNTNPLARINLFSEQKQWDYISEESYPVNIPLSSLTSSEEANLFGQNRRRFLKYGNYYSIDILLSAAKSPRNYQHGKFMMHLISYDSDKQPIAKSSRPVIFPYESTITTMFDTIIFYPLHLFGSSSNQESVSISINMMNKYLEPQAKKSPTQHLEFILSTSDVDIFDIFVTVMPSLNGIAYAMYYYPVLTFFIGVSLFTGIQWGGFVLFGLIAFVYRVSTASPPPHQPVAASSLNVPLPMDSISMELFRSTNQESNTTTNSNTVQAASSTVTSPTSYTWPQIPLEIAEYSEDELETDHEQVPGFIRAAGGGLLPDQLLEGDEVDDFSYAESKEDGSSIDDNGAPAPQEFQTELSINQSLETERLMDVPSQAIGRSFGSRVAGFAEDESELNQPNESKSDIANGDDEYEENWNTDSKSLRKRRSQSDSPLFSPNL